MRDDQGRSWHGWREQDHTERRRYPLRDLQSHPEKNTGHAAQQTHRGSGQLRSCAQRVFFRPAPGRVRSSAQLLQVGRAESRRINIFIRFDVFFSFFSAGRGNSITRPTCAGRSSRTNSSFGGWTRTRWSLVAGQLTASTGTLRWERRRFWMSLNASLFVSYSCQNTFRMRLEYR